MKTSILICARREPTVLPRIVRILYWQGVLPDLLCSETTGAGALQIRVEVDCDDWHLRRLLVHWQKIIGVQSVVATSLDGLGTPIPGTHLAPMAR